MEGHFWFADEVDVPSQLCDTSRAAHLAINFVLCHLTQEPGVADLVVPVHNVVPHAHSVFALARATLRLHTLVAGNTKKILMG